MTSSLFQRITSLQFSAVMLFIAVNVIICKPVSAMPLTNLSVAQGDTVEIVVPAYEYLSATGLYEDKKIPFYPITEKISEFSPISRAEFLQLIYQNNTALTFPSSVAADFTDVTTENPFNIAINQAASAGIVHGYEDGLFHPYDPVTRAQAAKIIMNAYHPEEHTPNPLDFPDIPEDYSLRDEIYAAIRAGIFQGYPDGLMRPDRPINFQEAHIIVDRAGHFGATLKKITERPAFRAFLGIHRLSSTGGKPLSVTLSSATSSPITLTTTLTINKQDFTTVRFSLPEDKSKLLGKTYQDNTWTLIDDAKKETSSTQLWQGPFIIPTQGEVTLGFGDKLYINGIYSGSHFGLDYANKEGTPVYAANSGVVTLAENTPAYGNTIVIDHGQNIFTMYLHLQDLLVQKGNSVQKNDLIATMGQTGIATGPHLHFTNFVGDIIVDSNYWYGKN